MRARIKNPALTVPGALKAMDMLGASAHYAEIPEATLSVVYLRASQINGCSVCIDIHSRELEHAGEPKCADLRRLGQARSAILHRSGARRARANRIRNEAR